MITRRFREILIPSALIALYFLAGTSAGGQVQDPLLFPKDRFTVETKTVTTSAGGKKVTYRSYMHIPYAAIPVDKDYQSLNVNVPIQIDGAAVDASNAPILLIIDVGGYMSSSNAGGGGGPGRMRAGVPPAGPGGNRGETPAQPGRQQGGMPPMPTGAPQAGPGGASVVSGNADLALAAGYVVVSPGCRGRDNKAADGTYYGKAPAALSPRFSAPRATTPCLTPISRRSAPPMRPTTSMPAPASAPSRIWSMPTGLTSGCTVPRQPGRVLWTRNFPNS